MNPPVKGGACCFAMLLLVETGETPSYFETISQVAGWWKQQHGDRTCLDMIFMIFGNLWTSIWVMFSFLLLPFSSSKLRKLSLERLRPPKALNSVTNRAWKARVQRWFPNKILMFQAFTHLNSYHFHLQLPAHSWQATFWTTSKMHEHKT